MADYRELLRRAISALPENNGAARRAVYEKARAALVAQLRAITPALPAREITQHRLQLEDCIRQVEQEASEAVITLGRDAFPDQPPSRPKAESKAATTVEARDTEPGQAKVPAPAEPVRPIIASTVTPVPAGTPAPLSPMVKAPEAPSAKPAPQPEAEAKSRADANFETETKAFENKSVTATSIEDIISQAAAASEVAVETTALAPVEDKSVLPMPANGPSRISPATPLKSPVFAPRREVPQPANLATAASMAPSRVEPSLSGAALARKPDPEAEAVAEVAPVEPALSSIREVEVEPDGTREAEGAIERAIETLDREARGETTEPLPDRTLAGGRTDETAEDAGFDAADTPPRSGTGLTIFLVVFALLLTGVGGAGYWAWNEGYIPLDQMFGRAQTTTATPAENTAPVTPSMDAPGNSGGNGAADTPGPGNTATTTTSEPTTSLEGMEIEDRLEPTPEAVTPTGAETVLPSLNNGEVKTEERLSSEETSIAAEDPAASVDPAVLAGNQSLLLEASANGRSGAVPFSGTVEWSEGVDELGLPTLIAEASIPARNLSVSVTIRKNSDQVLPASHLMEVNFAVPDTFIGGSITSLPGVLLKDEELVPGAPLVGASARIVGNSFLFALSASPEDAQTNSNLLQTRRWMDLAVVYGTGRNAILTLEKDDEAQALFEKVFAAWQ